MPHRLIEDLAHALATAPSASPGHAGDNGRDAALSVFTQMMDLWPDAVWLSPRGGGPVLYANPAFRALTGDLLDNGARARALLSLVHPDDWLVWSAATEHSPKAVPGPAGPQGPTASSVPHVVRLIGADGVPHPYTLRVIPVDASTAGIAASWAPKGLFVGILAAVAPARPHPTPVPSPPTVERLTLGPSKPLSPPAAAPVVLDSPLVEAPHSVPAAVAAIAERWRHSPRARTSPLFVGVIALMGVRALQNAWGRPVGDEVLRQSDQRLHAFARSHPNTVHHLIRLSPTEFVVVASPPDPAALASFADAVLDVWRQPFVVADRPMRVGAHLGLAPMDCFKVDCSKADGVSIDSAAFRSPAGPGRDLLDAADLVLRQADAACVTLRRSGAYAFAVHDPKEPAAAPPREALDVLDARELDEALRRGEFHLEFQPKIDAQTGMCHECEALARWVRPGVGPIAPTQFVPALEQSGLIDRLGVWVIDQACRHMQEWHDTAGLAIRVAVNVAPDQLRAPPGTTLRGAEALRHATFEALRKNPAAVLDFEITESTLIEPAPDIIAAMSDLNGAGVSWGIDDFGTGYSSLAYLRAFPVATVKIDRAFVAHMSTDPARPDPIVTAVVAMAHGLGCSVVAEGAETPAQVAALTRLGCDLIQGYAIAPPMPADAFVRWVARTNTAAMTDYLERLGEDGSAPRPASSVS